MLRSDCDATGGDLCSSIACAARAIFSQHHAFADRQKGRPTSPSRGCRLRFRIANISATANRVTPFFTSVPLHVSYYNTLQRSQHLRRILIVLIVFFLYIHDPSVVVCGDSRQRRCCFRCLRMRNGSRDQEPRLADVSVDRGREDRHPWNAESNITYTLAHADSERQTGRCEDAASYARSARHTGTL